MTAYEELQQLRGVGAATAQGLATAGFTSLLRVASALAARKRVALARLLVEEIGEDLLKTPAFRSALLKRLAGCPASRARIIQNGVADLG